MKVIYNWLKEFVDITASAERNRLAPRPFRYQHRQRRKRTPRRRHRRRSRLESTRLPQPLRNRARSQRRLQTAAQACLAKACGKLGKSQRSRKSRNPIARTLRPLHRSRHSRREDPAFTEVAKRPPRSLRRRQHQQRRRHLELRHARARPPASHLRLRQSPRSPNRCPPRKTQRKNPHARWHRAHARFSTSV